ncbi:plasmid replication protein RepC [Bradyrhizobium sp. CCGUVB23]|uniref:plasmid replication protein RepC n=1 Tax=Bradyrhizobium sp. CCGUVB23 TaxID=2949630 RepID=UPI0020B2B368|nr:plasmid replication protein RepC [Bradyrhizobium sp. CCGUVB23]MCP3468604.1 replication initiation protein RepC [Bradyrhizobium sp. CCGUVB23]
MVRATEIASFRRVTPAILASARLAMANDVPEVSKAEVAIVLKKAAPILGIDGSTYHIMDILIGLSRSDDWKGANRPIVAISNGKLAEYTARSERQVSRCIKRLVEAGIVAYRDSPTGRRFVYRDKGGGIDKGYGLDFTPARVRIKELKGLVDDFQARLNSEQEARRATTRLSRAIVDACDAYPERAEEWTAALGGVREQNLTSEGEAAALDDLHRRIVREVTAEYATDKMSCEGDTDVAPNINTTSQNSFESKNNPPRSNEREVLHEKNDRIAVVPPSERKSGPSSPLLLHNVGGHPPRGSEEIQSQILAAVSVSLIRSACPQACEITGRAFKNWPELVAGADMMRIMIGLSDAAWSDGTTRVGRYAAAAILATVLEKSMRSPDRISSPGGYFRAMVDRGVEGSLHLEKSLFGLADGALKRAREHKP